MRLLQLSHGEISLTKFVSNVPPYAILSHTWANDDSEIIFSDIKNGTAKTKTVAFKKLKFCGERALSDGLDYFWVDTCCIDRSDQNELQHAINSMFRWYRDAVRCYVYLSDISVTKKRKRTSSSKDPWESAFRISRWFTRGWTLQELIAPQSVEFFSQQGIRLGDKKSLERQIYEITGIPIKAFQGDSLTHFTVDERMSWAKARDTTYKEDKAYSLQGIFDVCMPFLYGEGEERAFSRLREEINNHQLRGNANTEGLLNSLPYAVDALFNASDKQHDPTCHPDTRVDLLQDIYSWADGDDPHFIYWLNGLAGTGKSTIARTVARTYFDRGCLGASFFFSRGGGDVGHARLFFPTIARQLAKMSRVLQQYICDAVRKNSDIANQSFSDQWRQLIYGPLRRFEMDMSLLCYVIVIDALDECNSSDNIEAILRLLAEARGLKRIRLRVLLTSRPELPIRHGFNEISVTEHRDFVLHNISPLTVNHDIFTFLDYKLGLIRQKRSLGASWPGEDTIKLLVKKASGLFIWAATTCRFVEEGGNRRLIKNRLSAILDTNSLTLEGDGPEEQLNAIYITVLGYSIPEKCSQDDRKELLNVFKNVVGSLVILLSPLSILSLARLVGLENEDVDDCFDSLHAILDISQDQRQPVRLHHPSFRDFLLSKKRCSDLDFWVDDKQANNLLVHRCILLMSSFLKQNICGVEIPGALISEIELAQLEVFLPPEIQYACQYWIQHIQKCSLQLQDNDFIHQFLKTHLLYWLEAMSCMQKISEAIQELNLLKSIIDVSVDCLY
jgi:heterokaryon incompatibility protein (HET)